MRMIDEKATEEQRELGKRMDAECAAKARANGEQTFTLRAQDQSSPRTIAFWILENIETCPQAKLVDALLDACAMREYPRRKHAD